MGDEHYRCVESGLVDCFVCIAVLGRDGHDWGRVPIIKAGQLTSNYGQLMNRIGPGLIALFDLPV